MKTASGLVKLVSWTTVLLLMLVARAPGGTMGKIAGMVSDKATGEPLVGANVMIKDLKTGASTDIRGQYYILNVPPGTYTMVFSMVGYETVVNSGVEVIVDRTAAISLALVPSTIQGEEVTIVAQRPVVDKDLTASQQIVASGVIEKSQARTIKDVLLTQTGFFRDNASLAWQRGITKDYVRGSSGVQSVYMVDNLSVNSGLVSDNYSGFNTSTIEQVSILTGGYNAEYGEGRSAVVNIISKEPALGMHGTAIARVRPPGVYHFGRNMYSTANNDYASTGINFWTAQSNDPSSAFYRLRPDSLLEAWRRQSSPNDTLGKYADRPEYEYEGTLLAGLTEQLGFMLSGRFKRGVGIFPQLIPYNPEFNVQGYVNYKFTPELKIRLGGFVGGYESADYTSSNMNTSEYGQESGWLAPMRIDEQYARAKYNLVGAPFRQWPEFRRWSQLYAKISQILNTQSFYELTVSYLKDRMDRSDRDHLLPDNVWGPVVVSMLPRYTLQDYYHTWTRSFSQSYQVKAEYTNQVTQAHNLKTGFTLKLDDFNYSNFASGSGATRVNEMNVFDGNPYEGSLYVQDKIETPGLTVNIGVRGDFFNQNRSASKNMFDPLAVEPTTPGHDPGAPLGIPGTPELERTKLQLAIAPRIGISHPISDNAVLHFVYGHFYQRPSWTKMFGFPFVNYTGITDSVLNPYAKQTTYMDEWQGYYGNPNLTYERTIQYELGVDYNIEDILKLQLTGYYKDGSNESNVVTGAYSAQHPTTKALMVSNTGYSDVRGIEARIDSRFRGPFNFGLSGEIYWSFDGQVGYSRLYEPGSQNIDVPKGLAQDRGPWTSLPRMKGWVSLSFPRGNGPELFGIHPFGDFNIYSTFWWREGDQFTYHGPGDRSTEPNNMRWFNYYQIDLKVSKGLDFFGTTLQLSIDIQNLLNSKFLRLLGGDDLLRYMQNPNLPDAQRLAKTFDFSEPDVWEWYSYEVPPRQIHFQVAVNF